MAEPSGWRERGKLCNEINIFNLSPDWVKKGKPKEFQFFGNNSVNLKSIKSVDGDTTFCLLFLCVYTHWRDNDDHDDDDENDSNKDNEDEREKSRRKIE